MTDIWTTKSLTTGIFAMKHFWKTIVMTVYIWKDKFGQQTFGLQTCGQQTFGQRMIGDIWSTDDWKTNI